MLHLGRFLFYHPHHRLNLSTRPAGDSPSSTPSRKSIREEDGPFYQAGGPPSKAPKMSEAETPGVAPPRSWEDTIVSQHRQQPALLKSPPSGACFSCKICIPPLSGSTLVTAGLAPSHGRQSLVCTITQLPPCVRAKDLNAWHSDPLLRSNTRYRDTGRSLAEGHSW